MVVLDSLAWVGIMTLAALVLRASSHPLARRSAIFGTLGVGAAHHALGWLPVWLLRPLTAQGASARDVVRYIYACATLRPSATLFYVHRLLGLTGTVSCWKAITVLPHAPTYLVLANLDSLAISAWVLVIAAARWRRDVPDSDLLAGEQTPRSLVTPRRALVAGLAIGIYHLFAQGQAVESWGSIVFIETELVLVLVLAPLLVLTPFVIGMGAIAVGRRERRRAGVRMLLSCLACWATIALFGAGAEQWRLHGFRRAAERARPLVARIRAYQRHTGTAPPSLVVLNPAYVVTTATRTGMGAYPEYELERRGQSRTRIVVNVPSGCLGIEMLVCDTHPPPTTDGARVIDRLDSWVLLR
ncbi:MAG: hypothetical protein U0166_20165 [Acidobacteriota bacterium]